MYTSGSGGQKQEGELAPVTKYRGWGLRTRDWGIGTGDWGLGTRDSLGAVSFQPSAVSQAGGNAEGGVPSVECDRAVW
jgi:hypothetical protein